MLKLTAQRLSQPSLLVRPHPFRTEGPRGFMLRLAEMNWFPVNELEALGIIYEPEVLLANGLLPNDAIDPALHQVVTAQSHLLFHHSRVWNHRYARFCPHCLADDPHWRTGWELLFHDACPEHGVWLIDQCSSCGDKITWQRDGLLRCQCGSDLRTEHSRVCPESVRRLSLLLVEKLQQGNKELFPVPVEETSLEQTQRLIRFLGTYLMPQSGRNPLKIRQAGSLVVSWPVTSFAAELLTDWPNAFFGALDKIQSEVAPSDARRLGGVFGRAYDYLYRGLYGKAFDSVRAAFETWLSHSWRGVLAKRNRRLALRLLKDATWIPANLACESLGISYQRLHHLIREGAIEGETHFGQSGRRFTMVRRDQLELVRHNLNGEIDMRMAGSALGLTKKRMRQILRRIFPNARKVGASASTPWCVSRAEVEHIIAISQDVPRVSIPDEGSVSMDHIFRYWAWTATEVASLIEAVRDGDLVPESFVDGGRGINGWVFQETTLKAWRARSIQGYGTWLTVPQVAKLIGIKEQVSYDVVNKHLMHSEAVHRQPRGGIRVHRREVERFKEEYVFCTEIAQTLGMSPRKAKAVLAEYNINPISGPGIDGARQLLYLRNERVINTLEVLKAKQSDSLNLL